MMYAWMGFLKSNAKVPQSVQEQMTDFLAQPLIKIRSIEPLRDAAGARAGMMMIFEDENRAAAEDFVSGSPYLRAGLYVDHRLYKYSNEVGW